MYPRPSLNLRQKPKLNKSMKEGHSQLLSSKLSQSLQDLSLISVQDDYNLLSPDQSEFKYRHSMSRKKQSNFNKKERKEKLRDSLVSRLDRNITPLQNINYQKCLLHGKVADLICLQDKAIVCCNCALFGQHKGHNVINLQGLLCKLTSFTEECLQKYEDLRQLKDQLNEEKYKSICEEKLMQRKQEQKRKIQTQFNDLIYVIKQAQKKAIFKLQSNYKQKLARLVKVPQLFTLTNKIEKWFQSVQGLSQFIQSNEQLQAYINSVKYIDGNGFGDEILKNGDRLIQEMKELEQKYEYKLNFQVQRQKYMFNDKIKKQIQNYCQLVNQEKKEDNIQMNILSQFNVQTQDDNLLASIAHQNEDPQSINPQQTYFENIPTLSISQIKFNACTTSSNQSSDCSRYIFKENYETILHYEQKKKKKFSVADKFKGTIDDLINDRAETIDLTGAQLGDANIIGLSQYLKKSKKLKVLKLIKNKLTDECVNELFSGIKDSKITSLNLSQNNFSEKAIVIIEKFSFNSLKNITFSLNKINRRNVRAKIQAFSNRSIHLLL